MFRSFLTRYLIVPAALLLTAFVATGHTQQAPASPEPRPKSTLTASAPFDCWTYYASYRCYPSAYRAACCLSRSGYCAQIVRSNCGCYYHVYYACAG